ncbi:MAG TPA: S8 family serine peptidase [Ignavibacteria bacterium]|nr:S8 family serine peptidase [Ignavibacteria bacterium]HQY52275.1 S8 family serine peptidase [Ignavibacteria bacterium]HRB01141.1 S8 family serine peptidase [Ignavibacteria bacterium]
MIKLLVVFLISSSVFIFSGNNVSSELTGDYISRISVKKIFLKTKKELPVSEATGEISLSSGISSLDKKLESYKVEKVKRVFKLNNGRKDLYEKFEMNRIYVLFLSEENKFDIESIVSDLNEEESVEYCEPVSSGYAAGVKELQTKNIFSDSNPENNPNDEMFYKQWYLQNNGSVDPTSGGLPKLGADIKIVYAWDIEEGSDEVVVAILDSGIKDDHPDLKDRIWINSGEIPNNGIDDDYNGYVDDIKGWDFAYDDKRPEDGFGHGTNIATVIGASTNNQIGFAGVDKKCRIMNCKNLNTYNSGEYDWWSESIKYAVDNGADIINMSEGGDDYSKVLKTAIEYAIESGVLVVSAMMNKGDNRNYYPAGFDGVMAVGATDTDDRRCSRFSWGGGSCWGDNISVVAPGNKIYGLDYENIDNYEVFWSGTSQSTAIVSAISSLLLAQNISRSSDDLKKIIKFTSRDLVGDPREDTSGWDQYYGFGRVDGFAALTYESSADPEKLEEITKEKKRKEIESVEENNKGNFNKDKATPENKDKEDVKSKSEYREPSKPK